jgi:magnesium transporter
MIRATRFTEGEVDARPVDLDDLAAACAAGGVVWIDAETPSPTELAALSGQLRLHHLVVEDLEKRQQRTKLVRYGDQVHVALRDCVLLDDHLDAREVDLIVTDRWVLTVRDPEHDDPATAIAPVVRHRFDTQRSDHGATTVGFLVWAVVDVVVDRYFEVTDAIDARLDDLEDLVFSDGADGIPRELFTLRRALVAFRRAVAPLREVVGEILRREVDAIEPESLDHLRDVHDHVLRLLDLVESQRELVTGLIEARLAVQSNHMNTVMKATSSWGAILIVATLVAGIYGMNFRHMPELDWRFGYPLSLATMLLLTFTLYRIFKSRGWL